MTIIEFDKERAEQSSCPCKKSEQAGRRLILPVAPRANAKIRFTASDTSRPGMLPHEALNWLSGLLNKKMAIEAVELKGPGDPLATPETTLETLSLVHEAFPGLGLKLTTVGLGAQDQAQELAKLGVSEVNLLVDAVTPEVAQKIYAWIRPSTKTVPLAKAVPLLLAQQAAAVTSLIKAGITATVTTTVYPGYNDEQVEAIARTVSGLGATCMTLQTLTAAGEDGPAPASAELLEKLKQQAAGHLPVSTNAPEAGVIEFGEAKDASGTNPLLPRPSKERPNLAVVSSNGMDIDLHLGQAYQVMIYGPRSEDGLSCFLEARPAPEAGSGASRWQDLAKVLPDCFCLLTASAGDSPRQVLAREGITVLLTDGEVEGTVEALFGGGKKGKGKR